jgi:hypothetical protein
VVLACQWAEHHRALWNPCLTGLNPRSRTPVQIGIAVMAVMIRVSSGIQHRVL